MSYARYLQTYRENRVQMADPGTILLMLYQGAIDFLRRAKTGMENGDVVEKGECILRAHAIISEFLASLDLQAGGELAQNLEGLYAFMLDQITIANLDNDAKPLETVISLLSTLKEGWEGAIAAQRNQAA